MKSLATAIAIAVTAFPHAAFAQGQPPTAPPLVSVASEDPWDGPLDLDAYPRAQRTAVWDQYARKNLISVNTLYPISGAIFFSVVSGLSQSLGFGSLGAISLPVEYERSLTRGFSVFGVLQPTFAVSGSDSEFTLGVGGGARTYFTGNAPQGAWVGVEADGVVGRPTVTIRAELGHNAIFASNLSLSVGVGLGLTYADDVLNPLTGVRIPFFPAAGLRLSLGYAL